MYNIMTKYALSLVLWLSFCVASGSAASFVLSGPWGMPNDGSVDCTKLGALSGHYPVAYDKDDSTPIIGMNYICRWVCIDNAWTYQRKPSLQTLNCAQYQQHIDKVALDQPESADAQWYAQFKSSAQQCYVADPCTQDHIHWSGMSFGAEGGQYQLGARDDGIVVWRKSSIQ